MVVRFDEKALIEGVKSKSAPEGLATKPGAISESEKILTNARKEAARKSSNSSLGNNSKEETDDSTQSKSEVDVPQSDQDQKPAIILPDDAKKRGGSLSSTNSGDLASAPVPAAGPAQKIE